MNVPKECNFEYPDYTHDEHWGQEVPSYMPGEAVKHYLKGDLAQKKETIFSGALNTLLFLTTQ